jgi:hypothetical protein
VHTAAYINLDGVVVPGRFLFGHGEASRQGIRTGRHTERPFMFSRPDDTRECYMSSCTCLRKRP